MFGSSLLDVSIGLIFVFLLVSLICTAANEVIEGWLKHRAIDLERGLRSLLAPGSKMGDSASDVVATLYRHPLIDGLFKGSYDESVARLRLGGLGNLLKRFLEGSSLPSYIPARNFALALMDTVRPAQATPSGEAIASGAAGALETPDPRVPASALPPFDPNNPLSDLRIAVGSNTVLTDSARQALLALIDAAGNDVSKARENIEGWFNAGMERVSGWYKRRTQVFILILGFLLAVILNIDPIVIAKRLSTDKSLREAVVVAAQEYAKANPSAASSKASADSSSNAPSSEFKERLQEIRNLSLPIGWGKDNAAKFSTIGCAGAGDWLLKILGWVITALAASLGAPFWFDTLSKFISVRSSAKPAEETKKEPAKQ